MSVHDALKVVSRTRVAAAAVRGYTADALSETLTQAADEIERLDEPRRYRREETFPEIREG